MNDVYYSLVDYIQKWGSSASIALFDPLCKAFSAPSIIGTIGYRIESNCAVVFGDPICPPEQLNKLVKEFHSYCTVQKLAPIYVTVSSPFTENMKKNGRCVLLSIGDELILDPMRDVMAETGSNARLLRKKYNNALREGVIIKEYTGQDQLFEQQCNELKKSWLAGRKGVQIYLSSVNIFENRSNKRWFYAEKEGKLVGLLMLNRIGMHDGWVQNMLMINSQAPQSTSELLILSALEALRNEGCQYYSVGAAPGKLTLIEGLGIIKTTLTQIAFKISKKIFNLNGRQKFWEKFSPISKPTYIVLPNGSLGVKEIRAIIRAFNVSF